jgi:hypothetical protein
MLCYKQTEQYLKGFGYWKELEGTNHIREKLKKLSLMRLEVRQNRRYLKLDRYKIFVIEISSRKHPEFQTDKKRNYFLALKWELLAVWNNYKKRWHS